MSGLPTPYRMQGPQAGMGALVRRPSAYRCQCSASGCPCSVNCTCGCRRGRPCTCGHQYDQQQQARTNTLLPDQQRWQRKNAGGCGCRKK